MWRHRDASSGQSDWIIIRIRTYDEMTTALLNLNSYLINVYRVEGDVEEEMLKVVKSLYDPKVEEKGIEKGIKIASDRKVRNGDTEQK